MMRSLTTASSGMVAQQLNLDTIANNLANVNTTAFKAQRAEFQDMVYEIMRGSGATNEGEARQLALQVGLGSKFSSSATNFSEGGLIITGKPENMAIRGNGFFQVTRPDGSIAYTRDGTFKLDSAGLLVSNDGYPLEPSVTIPTGATAVNVSQAGVVSAILAGNSEPTVLANITIAVFPNPEGLTRGGQNLYLASNASGEPTVVEPGQEGSGTLASGYVEGSNVQVVEEMVRMIMAQRAYEINSKAIQTSDEMLTVLNQLKR